MATAASRSARRRASSVAARVVTHQARLSERLPQTEGWLNEARDALAQDWAVEI